MTTREILSPLAFQLAGQGTLQVPPFIAVVKVMPCVFMGLSSQSVSLHCQAANLAILFGLTSKPRKTRETNVRAFYSLTFSFVLLCWPWYAQNLTVCRLKWAFPVSLAAGVIQHILVFLGFPVLCCQARAILVAATLSQWFVLSVYMLHPQLIRTKNQHPSSQGYIFMFYTIVEPAGYWEFSFSQQAPKTT